MSTSSSLATPLPPPLAPRAATTPLARDASALAPPPTSPVTLAAPQTPLAADAPALAPPPTSPVTLAAPQTPLASDAPALAPPHVPQVGQGPRPRRQPLPGPRLRSLLVSAAERAGHPHAEARELAAGLHELVAVRRADGRLHVPGRGELRFHGLDAAAAFARARGGTCGEILEFGRAGPLPGVHAYILGGPGGHDTAVAALELAGHGADEDNESDARPDLHLAGAPHSTAVHHPATPPPGAAHRRVGNRVGSDLGAALALAGGNLGSAGLVLSVPARGTALFLAPHARGLRRALAQLGRFRQFWCSDADDAPLQVDESLRFLATWTANAHARLPGPVSPALYWQRPGQPLLLLTPDAREPFTPPPALLLAATTHVP